MQDSLSSHIDPQLLEALSSEELGAIVRLKIAAAKFGLPSEDSLLARLARVSDERWAQIKPMVQRAFAAGWTSELTSAAAPIVTPSHRTPDPEKRRAQTAAATAARLSKSRAGPDKRTFPDVVQRSEPQKPSNVDLTSKNVPSTSSTLILNQKERSSSSENALALQRSIPVEEISERSALSNVDSTSKNVPSSFPTLSKPGASASEFTPQEMGARARALAKAADHEWNKCLLSNARFPWAAADRQIVPPQLVERLAIERHASPCRILFALQQITAMGMKWQPGKGDEPPNPLALIISALGAQLEEHKRKAPWDVPLGFIPVFDKAREHRDAIVAGQAMLDRARNRSRLSTSREEDGGSAFTEGTA